MVNGLTIAYEVIGDGRPWVITPGGRFSKDSPGVRELARELAAAGNRVLIWDRPNTGASDVCFTGPSESAMQADALAGLLAHLDMTPAVIAGGSGGSRVSLLTATRHPEVAAAVAAWWISGGIYGLLVARHPLLRRLHPRRLDRGDGGRRRPPRVGRGAGTEPGQPAAVPRPGPAGVHRHARALDGGVLPVRRRARPRAARCRRPQARHPRARVPQRGQRPQPHAGDVRAAGGACCPTPGSSSRPGATTSGTSARPPGPGAPARACSSAGRCWPPRCWRWADDVL